MPDWIVTLTFVDGPKQGDSITLSNPPPRFIKTAYPEWVVYERDGEGYRVLYEGITARAWRNPERTSLLW